jgi:hypothetical protein
MDPVRSTFKLSFYLVPSSGEGLSISGWYLIFGRDTNFALIKSSSRGGSKAVQRLWA